MRPQRTYPAKLFLFGEYTVLSGSRALAIPLPLWSGHWRFQDRGPDSRLFDFCAYLESRQILPPESLLAFRQDLQRGLHFDSSIPEGYGAGSSGALCAAVLDTYGQAALPEGSAQIREILAAMENAFHGQSSGMDPLISLTNTPVLRENQLYRMLETFVLPDSVRPFLLDSGIPRKTDALVRHFSERMSSPDFRVSCLQPLCQSVDHAIGFLIDFHAELFREHLKLISRIQFQYFDAAIPEHIRPVWARTLSGDDIILKLCGAGGGGFFLGFATTEAAFRTFEADCGLRLIRLHAD